MRKEERGSLLQKKNGKRKKREKKRERKEKEEKEKKELVSGPLKQKFSKKSW